MFGQYRTQRQGLTARRPRRHRLRALVASALAASALGTVAEGLATAVPASAAGPATQVVFTTRPPNLVDAGQQFTVQASVEDAQGNLVTSSTDSIELSFDVYAPGVPLFCNGGTSDVAAAVQGVATFECSIDVTGDYDFGLSDLTNPETVGSPGFSSFVGVDPGPPASVSFSVPPQNAATGVPFPVEVSLLDQYGNVDFEDSTDVATLTLGGGSGGAGLTCTPQGATSPSDSATLDFGVADLACSVSVAGTGYTMTATLSGGPASGLAVTSSPFDIGQESAAVVASPEPAASVNGVGGYSVTVTVHDAAGQPVAGDAVSVSADTPGEVTVVSSSANGSTDANGQLTVELQCPDVSGTFDVSATDTTTSTVVGDTQEACAQVGFPGQDPVGQQDSFTIVGGQPDAPVSVAFAADAAATPVPASLSGTCTTDATGSIDYGTCSYTVPSVPGATPPASILAILTVGTGAGAVTYDVPGFQLLPATSLLLSPASGPPGTSVDAAVAGFAGGELVDFYDGPTYVGTCTADPGGSCSIEFMAPPGPGGTSTVEADGETSGAFAEATFTATAALSLSQTSGSPDSSVMATATGFGANEVVDFTFGGNAVGSCTTDSDGVCTTGIVVPGGAAGPTTVTATGLSSGSTAAATFVATAVVLTPGTGPVGTTVQASAEGFQPGEIVDVSYDAVKQGSCQASAAGTCVVDFTVPAAEAHTYSVLAVGETSGTAGRATFSETAGLSLSPSSGAADTGLVASATGFQPGETVNFSVNGSFRTSCGADGGGSCSATLSAPAAGPGTYSISAHGAASGLSAAATFVETSPASLTLSPTSGNQGQNIGASVANFAPAENVNLFFDGISDGSCTTNASGACATGIEVPPSLAAGSYSVTALGSTGDSAGAGFTVEPSLALTPSSGEQGAGFTAIVDGFAAGENVQLTFAGVSVGGCSTNAAGDCSTPANVPAGIPAATYEVTATGQASSLTAQAPFSETPGVTLSPPTGPAGSTMSVNAVGFASGETVAVTFGGLAAGQCSADPAGDCTAQFTVPAEPAGSYPVAAKGSVSGLSASANFTESAAAPAVTAVAPSSGPTAGGTAVTVSGTGFVAGATVSFGTAKATNVVVVDAATITATSPAGAAGTVNVRVTTSLGTSPTSAADRFAYLVAPTVSKVAPAAGATAGGTAVTITGTAFAAPARVTFGTVPGTNVAVVSGTTITATVPAGSAGTVDVTVTTPGGTSATSAGDRYTYVVRPTVTSVSPDAGKVAGGTAVTITGTAFATGATVFFGGTKAGNVTVVNATTITANAPAGAAGTVDVTVTTAGGTSATSAADTFTYEARPTVTAVSPAAGPAAGGTTVTITGTGFVPGASVTFATGAASNVVVVSTTTITATAPAHAAGAVKVTVTTPGGTSATSSADRFTYLVAPTVTKLSPASGPAAGGTTVTITGSGFVAGATVSFGNAAAGNVVVVNASTITATAPAGTAGPVNVTVTTPGGTSTITAADRYTYL